MSDIQPYMAIGIPSFVALVGILVNVGYFVALNGRFQTLETRLDGRIDRLDGKFDRLETRFDARFASLEIKSDILTGKVIEIDNRLTRVEEQLKHLH